MPLRRRHIDQLADASDLEKFGLRHDSIDDPACALLGYQRTKQISKESQKAWEAGDKALLMQEIARRRDEIIEGAFLEVYKEYIPLRDALKGRKIGSVCDVGCGQGINDVFLHKEFAPEFTLVDIEETPDQYHFWADSGSGYASLNAARALLVENGVAEDRVQTVNPGKTDWTQTGHGFDLVTSLISCGFHYPVDGYIDLFLDTVASGGAVCLDLRKAYIDEGGESLSRLRNAGQETIVYNDRKSVRMLFHS